MSHNKIVIEIVDKVATCLTKKAIVCGNSKYVADFVFDEEWNEHEVKTAVFKVNGECFREVFKGTSCKIPAVQNTVAVTIGVFAGTIDDGTLSTTTPAMVRCKPCITDGESIPMPPQDDVYNQIVGLCEEAVSTAKSVEERANNGEFDGEKGEKGENGYTPQKGIDYYTPAEKAEVVNEVLNGVLTDYEAYLDSLLAEQEEIIDHLNELRGV